MSNTPSNSAETNQYIRPKFDLASAAARLASRGDGFANSAEFANTISAGVAAEFGMSLIDTLGDCSDACSSEDLFSVAKLISARQCTPNEADAGAEAPGTLADAKVRQAHDAKPMSGATHATGQMVELTLLTTAAATGPQHQFHVLSKGMCDLSVSAEASGRPTVMETWGDPVMRLGGVVPTWTSLLRPTMEEIRACRTYWP